MNQVADMAQKNAASFDRLTSLLEAVEIVNQPVEDCISQGGIRNTLVPVFHRDLVSGIPDRLVSDSMGALPWIMH